MNATRRRPIRYRRRAVRRRRLPRPMMANTGNTVICEYYDKIALTANSASLVFFSSGNAYINIDELLPLSVSYSTYSPLYNRMKITGISLTTSPCGGANQYPGMPDIVIGFIPQYHSTATAAVLDSVISNDSSMYASPGVINVQTKYWRFPNNYFTANNGTGYGVMFTPVQISSLPGELVVRTTQSLTAITSATCWLNLRVRVYVTFYDKYK